MVVICVRLVWWFRPRTDGVWMVILERNEVER